MKACWLIVLLILFGCTRSVGLKTVEQTAIDNCIQLCKDSEADLSEGPCLSNNVIDNWVCDVAHSPRADVDNILANQCPEFGKSAEHFVEVDEDCRLIRTK